MVEDESGESSAFDFLSPKEKVEAIIGVAHEPISREQALQYAGVNEDELSDELEGIFAHPDENGKFHNPGYITSHSEMDVRAAREQIVRVMMGKIRPEMPD